jgi:hypothetical protein
MAGFDFSNYNRNAALHAKGAPLPKATSTGTTIVGCIFDNGVVVSLFGVMAALWLMELTISTDRRRYQSDLWADSSRQELREVTLHRPQDLVRWCWYSC